MQLFLYHYYDAATGPFRNLSALSIEEAKQVQESLQQNKNMFASQRADDYIIIRRDLEMCARDLFIAKGGRPTNKYPHYMTLGPSDWIKQWYQNGREVKIPLDDVEPEMISFTYGDLFPTMRYKDDKPYRGKVHTLVPYLHFYISFWSLIPVFIPFLRPTIFVYQPEDFVL